MFRRLPLVAPRFRRSSSVFALPVRTFAALKSGDVRYSQTHEYIRLTGPDTGRIGISDYAQHELGDVVYVDMPEVNKSFAAGDAFGSVESVKAASAVYAPVDCTVTAVNDKLRADGGEINRTPETDAWIITVKLTHNAQSQLDKLMDSAAYKTFLAKKT